MYDIDYIVSGEHVLYVIHRVVYVWVICNSNTIRLRGSGGLRQVLKYS